MAAAPSSPFISLVAELSQGLELVEGLCLLLGRRQQGKALEPSGLSQALLVGWGHHAVTIGEGSLNQALDRRQ